MLPDKCAGPGKEKKNKPICPKFFMVKRNKHSLGIPQNFQILCTISKFANLHFIKVAKSAEKGLYSGKCPRPGKKKVCDQISQQERHICRLQELSGSLACSTSFTASHGDLNLHRVM